MVRDTIGHRSPPLLLVPSATAGGVPLAPARLVEGLSTHQCAGGPWRLEDRRNCSQVSPCAGRLPSGRGPNADRPSMSWATSTARRIAAATWIMSSTTVASRAYAVVPAKRSRWSRGGAYRPRSAPAAGSARHRADAGRRDRAARSPDPQPASCRRSFRRGYRARAAPSTRHHWLIDGPLLADKLKELKLGVRTHMVEDVEVVDEWFRTI